MEVDTFPGVVFCLWPGSRGWETGAVDYEGLLIKQDLHEGLRGVIGLCGVAPDIVLPRKSRYKGEAREAGHLVAVGGDNLGPVYHTLCHIMYHIYHAPFLSFAAVTRGCDRDRDRDRDVQASGGAARTGWRAWRLMDPCTRWVEVMGPLALPGVGGGSHRHMWTKDSLPDLFSSVHRWGRMPPRRRRRGPMTVSCGGCTPAARSSTSPTASEWGRASLDKLG
jgi:hypothetical protein